MNAAQLDTLYNLCPGDGGEFFRELLGLYLHDTTGHLARLGAALVTGDVAKITMAAHSIKGMSASIGAQRLAAVAAAVEMQAKAGNLQGAAQACIQLNADYLEVAAALTTLALASNAGAVAA